MGQLVQFKKKETPTDDTLFSCEIRFIEIEPTMDTTADKVFVSVTVFGITLVLGDILLGFW